MAFSSLGVGSGLDLNSILTGLMTAEKQPLLALQKKEATVQARISALGTLKSSLSTLQTAAKNLVPSTGQSASDKFATFTAAIADTTIASATTSSGAAAGNYSLEVSSLAKAHRLTSAAGTTNFSAGTLTISLGTLSGTSPNLAFAADNDRELNVTIAPGETSIEDVRDAINAAATDGRVSATIINGTAGKQLVLTSGKEGLGNTMAISGIPGIEYNPEVSGFGSLSQDAANGGQAPSNAEFTLNGIAIESSTNSVSDALDGVTLNLTKTNIGSPTTLTVTRDSTTALTASLNSFITAYNDATKSMKSLGYFDTTSQKAGALQGDGTLRSSQGLIRSLTLTRADSIAPGNTSEFQMLSDIGVSIESDGTLKLDTTKLGKATTADYAGVTSLVSIIGSEFKSKMEGLVGTSGNIAAATESANRTIRSLSSRELALQDRLVQIESRYRKQFSSLDSLIASMNKTSAYLTQQLASLPGASN